MLSFFLCCRKIKKKINLIQMKNYKKKVKKIVYFEEKNKIFNY